ncbi:MAG TPA: aminotransferase class I and II, partial [Sphingobacterium sp.]|nr:aminotransferase class I and II [Sphingobacterium sp.]
LAVVPDEWLEDAERELSAADAREVYVSFLKQRVANSSIFVKQIEDARKDRI